MASHEQALPPQDDAAPGSSEAPPPARPEDVAHAEPVLEVHNSPPARLEDITQDEPDSGIYNSPPGQPENNAQDAMAPEDAAAVDAALEAFDDSSIVADMDLEPPPPVHLSLRDDNIHCACPPGTERLPQDVIFTGIKDGHPTWIHLVCKPYTRQLSVSESAKLDSSLAGTAATSTPGQPNMAKTGADILTKWSGKLSAQNALMIKNFTSTFHCDGPCHHSTDFGDYINCRKCYAWQHKPCMLYGEQGDVGGPVCNRCYMIFLVHHDEILEWQRSRELQAARCAWNWLKHPTNSSKVERRVWAFKFLARYLYHNQGVFIKYVATRRQPQEDMMSEPPDVVDAPQEEIQVAEQQQEETTQPRGRLRGKSTRPQSLTDEDLAELGIAPPAAPTIEGSDDEIIVSTGKKMPRRESKKIKKERSSSPFNPTKAKGKKRKSGAYQVDDNTPRIKAKRKRTLSASPPPARGAGAPRKSVRKEIRGGRSNIPPPLFNDDEEDEEELLPNEQNPHLKGPDGRTSCKCWDMSPPAKECFECRECPNRQHKACAQDIEDGRPEICNVCFTQAIKEEEDEALIQQPVRKPSRPSAQLPPPAPAPIVPENYNAAVRDEILSLCSTVLWREYSLIPTPNEDVDAPIKDPPPFPPPDWLAEMQQRLFAFITAIGPEKTAQHMQGPLSVFPRDKNEIMKALRDLAVQEVFTGSYKGKRRLLGLFGEVLGLEEKGSQFPIPGRS